MPSCRYSVTNLSGGSSSLDDQMTAVRKVAFEALKTHSRILLTKLRPSEVRKSEGDEQMETNETAEKENSDVIKQICLQLALHSIENQIDDDAQLDPLPTTKQVVRAATLCHLPLPDDEWDLKTVREQLSGKLAEMGDVSVAGEQSVLVELLDSIMAALVRLIVHSTHDFRRQSIELIREITDLHPHFMIHVEAELERQLRQYHPYVMLNRNVLKAMEEIAFLSPHDRLKFFPRIFMNVFEKSHALPLSKENTATVALQMDPNDAVLATILGGPMRLKVRDDDGNTMAAGQVLGFAKIDPKTPKEEETPTNPATGITDADVEELKRFQTVDSAQIQRLVDLCSLVGTPPPRDLVQHLCGEVSSVFRYALDSLNVELMKQLIAMLDLLAVPQIERPFWFLVNLLSFAACVSETLEWADFEDLLRPLVKCLNIEAVPICAHILQRDFLSVLALRRLVIRIMGRKDAHPLRQALADSLPVAVELLLPATPADASTDDGIVMSGMRRQLCADFALLSMFRDLCADTLIDESVRLEVIAQAQRFWRSPEARQRYIVTGEPTLTDNALTDTIAAFHEKFSVPRICVLLFIEFLRTHLDRIDVLYDASLMFSHDFSVDYIFLNRFIETEVVPVVSLEWRRRAFRILIDFFADNQNLGSMPAECNALANFVLHVVIPCFVYAFNHYPNIEVVGAPPSPNAPNLDSIVWQLCKTIIGPYYQRQAPMAALEVPELMKVVLYQFSSLLVQKCPEHIFQDERSPPEQRSAKGCRQSECLQLFMLFGWPSLQQQQCGVMEKHAGQFLLANLVEKFSIQRRIINQTVSCMLAAHQQDLRDIVGHALNIIIPVMGSRFEGADQHLAVSIRKVVEETHQHSQIIHCLLIINRHYKVFFRVRHQCSELLVRFVQRLIATPYSSEVKRLMLDTCETMIKWEQHRVKLCEIAEAQTPPPEKVPQMPYQPVEYANLQNRFERPIINQMLDFAIRMIVSADTYGDGNTRRAVMLLRGALKPNVFGNGPIRSQYLEQQIRIPQINPDHPNALPDQQIQQIVHQTTQALEMLSLLVTCMPRELVGDFFRNYQRSVINCLVCHHNPIIQGAIKLTGKLAEASRLTAQGLEDFELLNREMCRHLNDTMTMVAQNGFTAQLTTGQTLQMAQQCCSLVRVLTKDNAAFLDTVIQGTFIKMLHRLVKEYNPPPFHSPESRDRPLWLTYRDLIVFCIEILRPRLPQLTAEMRRTIVQSLSPLAARFTDSRLLESLLELTSDLVRVDLNPHQNLGVPLALQIATTMQRALQSDASLMKSFLNTVMNIFETRLLRPSEGVQKLQFAFVWGLGSSDRTLRAKFFHLFEAQTPGALFERVMFILREQNWLQMSQFFWIPHCIHLLLRAAIGASIEQPTVEARARLLLSHCATFQRTAERLFDALELSAQLRERMDQQSGEPASPVKVDADSSIGSAEHKLNDVLLSGRILCEMIAAADMESIVRNLMELCHDEPRLARAVFVEFFASVWDQMPEQNTRARRIVAECFLVSGVMNIGHELPITPLHCFVEAFHRTKTDVRMRPEAMENAVIQHKCWYRILDDLERRNRNAEPTAVSMRRERKLTDEAANAHTLIRLYERLDEFDLLMEQWRRHSILKGTPKAMVMYHLDYFREARSCARDAMHEGQQLLATLANPANSQPKPEGEAEAADPPFCDARAVDEELRALEKIWIESCKALNQWPALMTYANNSRVADPVVTAEAAWHTDEWALVRDVIPQIEASGTRRHAFAAQTLRFMLAVEQAEMMSVKRLNDELWISLISEWRQLCPLVAGSHLEVLRTAQRLQEIDEASLVHRTAAEKKVRVPQLDYSAQQRQFPPLHTHRYTIDQSVIAPIKQTIKTWRNRPVIGIDPLVHWSDVYTWRIQQYLHVMRILENADTLTAFQQSQVMLPLHSISQTQIQYSHALRKSELFEEAAEELASLYGMIQIYPIDANLIIIEQAKCLVKLAEAIARRRTQPADSNNYAFESLLPADQSPRVLIEQALALLDSVNVDLWGKENGSRYFGIKGRILSSLGRDAEAHKCFLAGANLYEVGPTTSTISTSLVWKCWAQHLSGKVTAMVKQMRKDGFTAELCLAARSTALQAISASLECLRTVTDQKARKHGARLFHHIHVVYSLEAQLKAQNVEIPANAPTVDTAISDYGMSVPPSNWLFWTEQIISIIRTHKSEPMSKILRCVAEVSPQQVLVLLRTAVWPDLIQRRIHEWQCRMPLITDWVACAPALDDEVPPDEPKKPAAAAAAGPTDSGINSQASEDDAEEFESIGVLPKRDPANPALEPFAHECGELAQMEATPNEIADLKILIDRLSQRIRRCADTAIRRELENQRRALENRLRKRQPAGERSADPLPQWTELLLTAVDAMCANRFADVKAMNIILNELDAFPTQWAEDLYLELQRLAELAFRDAFALQSDPAKSPNASADLRLLIENILELHQLNVEETEMEVDAATAEDRMRNRIAGELKALSETQFPLFPLCERLCHWLAALESELRGVDRLVPLKEISPKLAAFSSRTSQLDVPSYWVSTKSVQFATQIAYFLPLCRQFCTHSGMVWMVGVLSQSGKVYAYRMERKSYSRSASRMNQLFGLLNLEFQKNREIFRRFGQFALADVLHTGLNYQLTEAYPMTGTFDSQSFVSAEHYGNNLHSMYDLCALTVPAAASDSLWLLLADHYRQLGVDPTAPSPLTAEGSPLRPHLLADWMHDHFPDIATYWIVRKRLTIQWVLFTAAQVLLGLRTLNLREMRLDLPSAQLFATAQEFDFTATEDGYQLGDITPLRFTPNLNDYFLNTVQANGEVTLSGHITGLFATIIRAMSIQNYTPYLNALFWDALEEFRDPNWSDAQSAQHSLQAAVHFPERIQRRIQKMNVFNADKALAVEIIEEAVRTHTNIDPSQQSWF